MAAFPIESLIDLNSMKNVGPSVVTDDIGGRLRRAREQRGLSLHDLARRTKLTIAVLRAIERNDFTCLPGGMFRKAYVRTLAAELGLNANDIAADYCAWFEPPVEPLNVPNRAAGLRERWVRRLLQRSAE